MVASKKIEVINMPTILSNAQTFLPKPFLVKSFRVMW